MSKHQAADEQPQASDISWIQGLAKPADSTPSDTLPFYGNLVARAPRHFAPGELPSEAEPVGSTTGPMARLSADRIDSLIAHLDASPEAQSNEPAAAPSELELADQVEPDPAEAEPSMADSAETDPSEADSAQTDPTEADSAESPAPAAESAQTESAEADQVRAPKRSKLRKPLLIAAAAVLSVLTIGGGTVTAMQKHVSIVVDGQTRQVSTMSSSVAGALAAAGISPDSHDTLAPAINSSISDGSKIVLNRGRLLTLTIDGQQRKVWTTARTVDEALAELGTRTADLSLSANRSRAIPVTGLASSGATLHTVGMSVAGAKAASSTTTAKTVGDLLVEKKVTLGRPRHGHAGRGHQADRRPCHQGQPDGRQPHQQGRRRYPSRPRSRSRTRDRLRNVDGRPAG